MVTSEQVGNAVSSIFDLITGGSSNVTPENALGSSTPPAANLASSGASSTPTIHFHSSWVIIPAVVLAVGTALWFFLKKVF